MRAQALYTRPIMRPNSARLTLAALAFALVLTGWGCKKRPVEQPIAPPQANQPILPSDASRSENYALVPLKQELQVAPATSTESTTSTTSTTE